MYTHHKLSRVMIRPDFGQLMKAFYSLALPPSTGYTLYPCQNTPSTFAMLIIIPLVLLSSCVYA